MTLCPACGADSERIYRCSECNKDLVDVEEDDRSENLRSITDGGRTDGDPCPECGEKMDVEAVGTDGETIAYQVCEDCEIGCDPYFGRVDTSGLKEKTVTDGGHPPGVSPTEEHPESENERVDRAIDEAVELVQEGDSLQVAVDYVVDVYPAAHPVPDQVHYGSTQNAVRTLHLDPDCERLRADQVSHAPAANPPRGSLCDHCGRGLDRHDLLEADQSDRPVATDGGSDVCADDVDQLIQDYLDDRDELQDATLRAREYAIRDFLDWIEELDGHSLQAELNDSGGGSDG